MRAWHEYISSRTVADPAAVDVVVVGALQDAAPSVLDEIWHDTDNRREQGLARR